MFRCTHYYWVHKKKNIEYIYNNVSIRINRKNPTKDEKKLCKIIRDILKGDAGDESTAFYIGFSKKGDLKFYSGYDRGVYDRWTTDQYHKTKGIEISLKGDALISVSLYS